MKPVFSDLSRITEDDVEEFGIDWAERDGFSIVKMRVEMLWGPDSQKPLFKRGMLQRPKLARVAKLLVGGIKVKDIVRKEHISAPTIRRLRRGLESQGIKTQRWTTTSLVDLVGRKFGRLTALRRNGSDKYGRAKWLCECKCGNRISTESQGLRTGRTKSCGCLHREIAKNLGLSHLGKRRLKFVASTMRGRTFKRNGHGTIYSRRARDELRDSYVRLTLRHFVKTNEIPAEFIEAKRQHILLKRQLKEMRK